MSIIDKARADEAHEEHSLQVGIWVEILAGDEWVTVDYGHDVPRFCTELFERLTAGGIPARVRTRTEVTKTALLNEWAVAD